MEMRLLLGVNTELCCVLLINALFLIDITSLEKLYCRPRNSWYVAVIKGPSALTRSQMRSSFVCAILGIVLTCLIIISFVVYFGANAVVIGVMVALMVVCCFPSCRQTVRTFNMAKDVAGIHAPASELQAQSDPANTDDADKEKDVTDNAKNSEMGLTGTSDSEGVFQVCVTYRTTSATERLCWIMFVLEITLFFLWPLISLYLTGDIGIGSFFLVIGLFSLLRYYMNAGVVLEEVGNLHALRGEDEHETWRSRSRTNDIVSNITRSRTRGECLCCCLQRVKFIRWDFSH